ncbi:MAG: putative Ig domain-containing protein, partial [Terriglobales bacterium]
MSWSGKLFVILSVLGASLWLMPSASAEVTVTVTPSSVAINPGAQQQFSAQVTGTGTGTGDQGVTWSLSGCNGIDCGYISLSGLYTAPTTIPIPNQVTVIATTLLYPYVSGSAAVSINTPIVVKVAPTFVQLNTGAQQQFTATVSGTSNTRVIWSATAGSVDANGLYTAPTVNAQTNALVTATSYADSSKSASAAVTVDPVNNQSLQITTGNLPQGQQGNTYGEVFTATGGTTPYSWSISAGTPPPGIAMNANGDFAGIPTTLGTFNLTVTVTDATNLTATGNFSVTIIAGGNYDGPAELPLVTVPSAMSDTPASGSVINVNAGGDLQAALNNASCGDVIELQAGATFTGHFTVPAKNCDIN